MHPQQISPRQRLTHSLGTLALDRGRNPQGTIAISLVGSELSTLVDAADWRALKAYRWIAHSGRPGHIYAATIYTDGRANHRVKHTVRLHRFLMGATAGQIVDHINGDKLDNRRANLRLTDAAGNSKNARKRSGAGGGKSRFKGLTFVAYSKSRPWKAFVYSDRVRHYAGSYETEEAAARAYDELASRLHGEYACTNVQLGLLPPL